MIMIRHCPLAMKWYITKAALHVHGNMSFSQLCLH